MMCPAFIHRQLGSFSGKVTYRCSGEQCHFIARRSYVQFLKHGFFFFCFCLFVLPALAYVLSRYTGFLPQSQKQANHTQNDPIGVRTCSQSAVPTTTVPSSEHNVCKFLLKCVLVHQINSGWMLLKDGF